MISQWINVTQGLKFDYSWQITIGKIYILSKPLVHQALKRLHAAYMNWNLQGELQVISAAKFSKYGVADIREGNQGTTLDYS